VVATPFDSRCINRAAIEFRSVVRVRTMKRAADSTRVLVTIPKDVRQWLDERAHYNGATLSAEVTRSLRDRMERGDQGSQARRRCGVADHG
jgi:hypothetical protein